MDTRERIFKALTRDNPLIYFLNQSALNYAQDDLGNVAIVPQYFFDKDTVKQYNRKIEEVVNRLAQSLKLTEGTQYEKELKIHDWLCENVDYDVKGHDTKNVAKFITAHNIIGVFAHHKAQCEGIAKATKVLLNAVDIKCIVGTGVANGNGQNGPHAWNIVSIDDKPYQVDVTFDIGSNQGKAASKSSSGRVFYDYFNLTDLEMSRTHKADQQLPVCDSDEKNYFVINQTSFSSKSQAIKYVEDKLSKGQKEFYFRLEGRARIKETSMAVKDLIKSYCAENGNTGVKIHEMVNEERKVCWFKLS